MACRAGNGAEFAAGHCQCGSHDTAEKPYLMDIFFLLVPLSVLLAFAVMGVLAWAVWSGKFEDMEREAERILHDDVEKTR